MGRVRSGEAAASGSVSKTSSAAAIWPSARTRSSAPGAISSARAVLTSSAPGFRERSSGSLIMPRVSSVSSRWSETRSAVASSSGSSTNRWAARSAGPGRGAASRRRRACRSPRAGREPRADAAVADDPGRLPGQLDALARRATPPPGRRGRCRRRSWPARARGRGRARRRRRRRSGRRSRPRCRSPCGRQVDEGGRAGAGERDQPRARAAAQHRAGKVRAEDDDGGVADPGDQLVVVRGRSA